MVPVKVNYLNNKELLAEIHKSKTSYSYFVEKSYSQYDYIVNDLEQITPELIATVQAKRASQMMAADKAEQKLRGLKNHQIKVAEVDPTTIPVESLVWRLNTFSHIPEAPGRVKNPKTVADNHAKLNFPPFKHYVLRDDGFEEVGRSHWKDALDNGTFSVDHGKITNRLAMMFMKLCERYSQRGNWRGYTYVDEMRSQALLQLSLVGLQFDESRSEIPNPFAYYTVTVSNAFTRVLNLEKRNQNIRDDILIMNGVSPSMTRQINNELEQKAAMDAHDRGEAPPVPEAPKKGRPGRPPKAKSKAMYENDTLWQHSHDAFPAPDSKVK